MNTDDQRGDETQEYGDPVVIGAGLREVELHLRDTLQAEALTISPGHRLDAILSAANADRPSSSLRSSGADGLSRRRTPWLAVAAAAAVAAVVAGSLWITGRPKTTPAPADTTTSQTSSGPTTPSTSSGSPSSVPTSAATSPTAPTTRPTTSGGAVPGADLTGIPVYWLGETGGDVRLFREFRTVPDTGGGRVEAAVAALTRMAPLDPDYVNPWRPASRVEVTQSGTSLTVDLSADAISGTNVGSAAAARAVQQLVWTATAAAAGTKTPADTVTILIDGKPADAWGVVQLGQPTKRLPMAEVQSHAWLTDPQEGDMRFSGVVTFTGYGTSFEANFLWKITKTGGQVVASNHVMGGRGDGTFGEFRFTQRLTPGSYVVELSTDDPSGGEGGGPDVDTKTFTVR